MAFPNNGRPIYCHHRCAPKVKMRVLHPRMYCNLLSKKFHPRWQMKLNKIVKKNSSIKNNYNNYLTIILYVQYIFLHIKLNVIKVLIELLPMNSVSD